MQKNKQSDRRNKQSNKILVKETKGTLPVYIKVKKNTNKIERSICGCQARIHPLINNCLRCGRIVCTQEGPGPCFFCGHNVTRSGEPQNDPFVGKSNDEEYIKAKENLDKLLMYDKTMAKRTTIFDDQNDYFDMKNKWLSEEEKNILIEKEKEKLKHKNKQVTYTIDLQNRIVIEDTTVSCESNDNYNDYIKMKETEDKALEQDMRMKELYLKAQRNEDGSLYISPTLESSPPKYINKGKKNNKKPNTNKKHRERVQHEYYPQVEVLL